MIGPAPRRGTGSANAKPAVILGIQKQPGANALALTRTLDRILDDLQAQLPPGMKIDKRIFRQADFIEVAVRNVQHALRDAGVLVIIIVLLFLGNLRATFITLTAIPLSLVVTTLVFRLIGAVTGTELSINVMTLGGIAVAMGELVDDAIVDVENIFRRLKENHALPRPRPAVQVIYEASVEVRGAIVFGTLMERVYGDSEIRVNSMHHQAVDDVAPGFAVTARCPDGVVEAIESTRDDWFAVTSAHFWGMLASVLFLSLGAPFWFNLLKNMTSLKSAVAIKKPGDGDVDGIEEGMVVRPSAGARRLPALPGRNAAKPATNKPAAEGTDSAS